MIFKAPSKTCQSGFTLLEILAAFLIFGLSFSVAMQGMSGSLRNTRVSGQLTQVALYAQSKMDLLGINERVEEGTDSGDFDDTYSWTMNVELYEPFSEGGGDPELIPIDLYKVTLEIFWDKGTTEISTRYTTLYALDSNFESRAFGDQ